MADHVLASLIHGIGSLLTSGATDHGRRLFSTGRDVGWLRDELHSMRLFLRDMEVCGTEGSVAAEAWIDQMRDIMLDSEDAVDSFDASQQVRGCCVLGKLRSRHDVGSRIRRIRTQLSDISRRRSEYAVERPMVSSSDKWIHGLFESCPLVPVSDTVGLDGDLDVLLRYILDGGLELSVVSLVGMGGVGKTTLAKKVYAHLDVKKHFDRFSWIYVSNTTELRHVLCEMAKGLMRILSAEASSLGERQLQELLLGGLDGQRFLLVFDDVWDKALWEVIKLVLPRDCSGSRVIVTTRNTVVADSVVDVNSNVHRLQPLPFDDSWNLFCRKASLQEGICPDGLKETAKDIVKKRVGLPLAIVVAGSMMSRK